MKCFVPKTVQARPFAVATVRARPQRAAMVAAKVETEVDTKVEEEEESYAGPVNFEEVADIIRKINDTDIVEFALKSKRFSLTLKKREALEQAAAPAPAPVQQMQNPFPYPYPFPQAPQAPAPAPAPAPPAPAPVAAAPAPAAPAPAPAAAPKAKGKPDGIEVTSPMAGTFYGSAAPGEPQFVKVGDRVTKGQTIGIIEAMKLMNEIEAEIGGTVTALLVSNGETVLPGQPLVVIKP